MSYRQTSREAILNPSSLMRRDPLSHYENHGSSMAYWASKTMRLRNTVGNSRGRLGEVKDAPDIANLDDVASEAGTVRPIPAAYAAPWNRID
mgnify:CR=1 FL=1